MDTMPKNINLNEAFDKAKQGVGKLVGNIINGAEEVWKFVKNPRAQAALLALAGTLIQYQTVSANQSVGPLGGSFVNPRVDALNLAIQKEDGITDTNDAVSGLVRDGYHAISCRAEDGNTYQTGFIDFTGVPLSAIDAVRNGLNSDNSTKIGGPDESVNAAVYEQWGNSVREITPEFTLHAKVGDQTCTLQALILGGGGPYDDFKPDSMYGAGGKAHINLSNPVINYEGFFVPDNQK
jgi:hypothetical protein